MNDSGPILKPVQAEFEKGAELLGDAHPLLEQLGSIDGLVTLSTASASLGRPKVDSLETLVLFLEGYRADMLLPFELPLIHRAHYHTSHNETRELIALDQFVARQPTLHDFASASRRVGRSQLQRLRPLRDERVVQRYLRAVDEGRAQSWHTLVYGMTLALYSLPVRQGLMGYARHTLRGFIDAAARPLQLAAHDCHQVLEQLAADLPKNLESVLAANVLGVTR